MCPCQRFSGESLSMSCVPIRHVAKCFGNNEQGVINV